MPEPGKLHKRESWTMSNTEHKRRSARGWLTRAVNSLNNICESDPTNTKEIQDAIVEFDKRMASLEEIQNEFELYIQDEEEFQRDLDAAGAFRDQAFISRKKAERLINSQQSDLIHSQQGEDVSVSSATIAAAKLPKLELPQFNGNHLEWQSFWEQFVAAVHNADLPDVSKFTYLRSLLKGEAKSAIQGLSLSGQHYSHACSILQKRFGRPEKIIFTHIQELLSWDIPKLEKGNLWNFYDKLISHVRSLDVLGISGKQYGVILTPLILSRLPQDIRIQWARVGESHESDLEYLLEFLQKELECRERSQTFSKEPVQKEAHGISTSSTATALHTSSSKPVCGVCKRPGHPTQKCFRISKGPIQDRKAALFKARLCYKCLSSIDGHSCRQCTATCGLCHGGHHELLCEGTSAKKKSVQYSNVVVTNEEQSTGNVISNVTVASSVNSKTGVSSRVLLQIGRVPICCNSKSGSIDAVVLFDTGSDRTYVTEAFVEKAKPVWVGSQCLAQAVFGSNKVGTGEQRNLYRLTIKGHRVVKSVVAAEVPVVCATLFRPAVAADLLDGFGDDIQFIDVPSGSEVKVDLIIGLDHYWDLMTCEMVRSASGLVAQKSLCGWILSGSVPGHLDSPSRSVSHQFLCTSLSESGLQALWDLETLGIKDQHDACVHPVLSEFNRTIKCSDTGRYVVSLPWKQGRSLPTLVNNEKLALTRLTHLTDRLKKTPALEGRYHDVFTDMFKEGIIEEVKVDTMDTVGPVFYMPHRPVVKESRLTSKIRPVFDASAKSFNGVSLNDCLETGPCLLPNLPGILLRFRRWKVALTADITKAFLQIEVREEDRNVHRFLWNDKGRVRKMRFVRVPFGNKSSPFLLNATVKHHLSKFQPTRVVNELYENMYVDDWLSGCDDDSEGCDMLKEAVEIMHQAAMPLTKWGSNSTKVGEFLCREFKDKSVGEESIKVLGMRWLSSLDFFAFDGMDIPNAICVTKRVVLSVMSRLFDPLGFIAPFVMSAKCLFQKLWKLGVGWDEVVSDDLSKAFLLWIKGLDSIKSWRIPRSYLGVPWGDAVAFELHAFGDASQSAYGACVYLRALLKDGLWLSSLVIARARVAPLKCQSLPRLELLGALLCARLVAYVKKELKFSDDVACHCWTDSMVTLAWIQGDPHKWKAFVANRVSEIQGLVDPCHWHHCPGTENPADLLTRGIPAADLVVSKIWIHGPPFLFKSDCDLGGRCLETDGILRNVPEAVTCTVTTRPLVYEPVLSLERLSSFSKAVRVLAWILRFLHNCKVSNTGCHLGNLSQVELQDSQLRLVKYVQNLAFPQDLTAILRGDSLPSRSSLVKLDPFIDSDGVLRIKGRLQHSDLPYDSIHPIILPKCHLGLLLARDVHIRMKHAGVNSMLVTLRNRYWLLGARRICKTVKRSCVSCQRLDAPAVAQTMAPLPDLRVKRSPPFTASGLDHAGPLFCSDFVGKKFYILLFTCAVTRAVHLELVTSLSSEITLLALRRFIARRGMPAVIFSDNAKCFCTAADQLLKTFGSDSPRWNFSPPRAPWWGGWWERLVGSTKSALKRSIGKRLLSCTELETMLHEVEACLNSRPLTFVGDDIDSGVPLTPSHFLLGRSSSLVPPEMEKTFKPDKHDIVSRYDFRCHLMTKFWTCWSNEYIRNLPPYSGKSSSQDIKVGEVVMIRDESAPRLKWPLGIVTKVFPGKDGLVRCLEVKTTRNILKRPIQKVHKLELNDSHDDTTLTLQQPEINSSQNSDPVSVDTVGSTDIIKTRYGRQVKKPVRL